jgi:hypothetical protein
MPVRLVGSRDARVRSAELFAAKAGELTRGMESLLAVRATVVHQTLIEKSRKIELTERWARDSAERIKGLLSAVPNRRAAEAVTDTVLTAAALADLETNRWEYLLALLEAERLTLGGYPSGVVEAVDRSIPDRRPCFPEAPSPVLPALPDHSGASVR